MAIRTALRKTCREPARHHRDHPAQPEARTRIEPKHTVSRWLLAGHIGGEPSAWQRHDSPTEVVDRPKTGDRINPIPSPAVTSATSVAKGTRTPKYGLVGVVTEVPVAAVGGVAFAG